MAQGLKQIRLYHGSYHAISRFRDARSEDMAGIYFTPSLEEAIVHARDNCVDEEDEPTVMVASVDIRYPRTMTGVESHVITPEQRDKLIAIGFDGVIGTQNGVPVEYVAFSAAQVTVLEIKKFDRDNITLAPA